MVREMSPDRWKRVEALFHEALTRPPADRAAFLASACSGDEALRREVESLLDEKISDDGVIGGAVNAARIAPEALETAEIMSGRTLGGYPLEMLIGAGAMGEVSRARDPQPAPAA